MVGEPSAEKKPEWYVRTAREISLFFGLSYSHVLDSQWYKDAVPGKDPELGFYLPELVQRRHQQSMRNPALQVEDGSDIAELRKGKLVQEERKLARENDVAEKLLLHKEDVERYLTQWAVRFRTPLLRLPDKISNRVPGSMKASVKAEVEDDVVASLKMVRDLRLEDSVVRDLICAEADRIRADEKPEIEKRPRTAKKKKAARRKRKAKAKT